MKCQHSYHSQSWISVIKDTISEQQPMNTDIMSWEWISGWHPDHCEPASTWKQRGVRAKRLVQSVWKLRKGDDWRAASVQAETIPPLHKNALGFHEKVYFHSSKPLWFDSTANILSPKTWGSLCQINPRGLFKRSEARCLDTYGYSLYQTHKEILVRGCSEALPKIATLFVQLSEYDTYSLIEFLALSLFKFCILYYRFARRSAQAKCPLTKQVRVQLDQILCQIFSCLKKQTSRHGVLVQLHSRVGHKHLTAGL